jgi:Fe2+ or Zn2+ uptake regulation protein
VVDLFLRRARQLDLSSLAKQGYVVTTHNLTVHGICRVCAARRRASRSQRPSARKA